MSLPRFCRSRTIPQYETGEEDAAGGVQSQVPAPGRAGTPGGRPESGPCPVEEGSPWEHLPTWGLCQKVLSAQPQAACRIISPLSGCPRKGCGGQSPIHSKCGPWCQPWWAGSPLNQPAGRHDPLWADGAVGQAYLPLCQALVDFPGGSDSKESACDAGGLGLIPGSGRTPREGNGNPLRYPGLENPHGQRSLWATVHGVTKSRTRLSN